MAQHISHRPEEDCTEEEEEEPLTRKEYADDKCLSEYDREDHTVSPYPPHLLHQWIYEVLPLEYFAYHIRHVRVQHYYSPNGKQVSLRFDNLFYMEHHLDPSQSFFIIEYCRPIFPRLTEPTLIPVKEIQTILSTMGHSADATTEYREMVSTICADTGLSPDACDLPLRVLYSYPVTRRAHERLLMLHNGITEEEYDSYVYQAWKRDPRYDQCMDDMMRIPHLPRHIRSLFRQCDNIGTIRDALEEEGIQVPHPLSEYLQPYEALEEQIYFARDRMVIGLLDVA